MHGRLTRTVILAAGVAIGCNSDSSPMSMGEAPPPMREAGVDSAAPGEAAASSDSSADAAMTEAAPDAAFDSALFDAIATDASLESDSPGVLSGDGAPIPGPPLCDPAHIWKAAGLIGSVPPANFGRLGGISADETVIAWTSPAGVIYVDDRPLPGQAFSATPSAIDTSSTPVASDRVALGSTGMQLFAVSADRKSFVAFYRSGVGAAWGASGASQFANVADLVTDGGQFSEPVLGANDNSFFYLITPPNAAPLLFESTWEATQHVWTTGTALPNAELASQSATVRRRPTGAAADGRTLFFFDEVTGQERAAWRDRSNSPFVQFVDTPGMTEAAPNSRCDVLYFQQRAADSSTSSAPAIAH
jgi:hypothetical protein